MNSFGNRHETAFLLSIRELFIRDGKVVGRLTGIVNDLRAIDGLSRDGSEVTLEAESGLQIVENNGKVRRSGEAESFVWPRDAPELYVKFQNRKGLATTEQTAAILKLLGEYESRK
jgi:hypothetical protein